MDLNAQPESIQHTTTFAQDMIGQQQTASPALAVQQAVVDTPEDERQSYPTDLTDVHWQRIVPLLPPTELNGRLRSVELREVINGILYVVCGSHDWLSFPRDLPSRSTVYSYFRRWQSDGTLQGILNALCADEEVVGLEDPVGVASRDPVLGEPVSGGLVSVGDDIHNIAPLADAQGTRILYRHSNFFVLAPSHQSRRPASRFAHQGVEADLDDRPAIDRETMIYRRAIALDAHTRSERDRSATLLRATTWKIPTWLETILLIVVLAASGAAHAINMFNYPHYEQDEGTYMMYAWAVTRGMLSPYAYGYGHPPLAWMQIAAWTRLTGGFYAFGNALNSGRVLMLLYAVACTLLVYLIARHLGASFIIRLLAVGIFTFSPLSITFQREVLLDNVAAFWFLLSLYLIVVGKSHLFYITGAAVSFGISLLSKEVIIIFFPVLIYGIWLYTTKFQRKFALVAFTYIVIAIGSTFVLMAVLKGELFPYSWHLPWDHHPHLSLIDTYITQAGRGQQQGSIKDSWKAWTQGDPLLVLLGFAAPAFNSLTGWWNRKGLFLALFAAIFWFLLLRGGVVFAFYIIPLIPIIALNLAIALSTLTRWISKLLRFELIGVVLVLGALLALVPYYIQHDANPYNVFTLRPAIVQNEAMLWIRANVPRRAVIAINSNLFVDLHEPESESVGDGAPYPYAQVYWFVALDPALHDKLLRGNWDRIDYIVVDAEMLTDIKTYGGGMEFINTALNHSVLRIEFKGDNNEFIRIYQVLHKQPPPQP